MAAGYSIGQLWSKSRDNGSRVKPCVGVLVFDICACCLLVIQTKRKYEWNTSSKSRCNTYWYMHITILMSWYDAHHGTVIVWLTSTNLRNLMLVFPTYLRRVKNVHLFPFLLACITWIMWIILLTPLFVLNLCIPKLQTIVLIGRYIWISNVSLTFKNNILALKQKTNIGSKSTNHWCHSI